jgi:hypothetical protein
MKKKKIETRTASVSLGIPTPDKTVELLEKIDTAHNLPIPKESDLKHNIPLGVKFFYKIQSTKNNSDYSYEECGVGYLKKARNKKFLVREKIFYYYNDVDGFLSARSGTIKQITPQDGEHLLVTTDIPSDYKRLFSIEDSVMCCTDLYTPTPVQLQNKTLLGKLGDIIQSIDKYELWSILSEHKDKESLKPVKGSIRYNKKDECFEGYNGERWRALMWGEK